MRTVVGLCLALALAACGDEARENLAELATVESPGLELRELPSSVLRSVGLPYGLVVVKAGGLAERAGLRMGDVIYGVDRKKIGSLEEFRQLVAAPREDKRLGLLVRRGASDFYVALDLGGLAPPKRNLPPRETPLRT